MLTIVVSPVSDEPCSWDTSSLSDCSNEWIDSTRNYGGSFDSEGSDISCNYIGEKGFGDQMMMGWMSSPEMMSSEEESLRSKRFKVSSSVVIPPSFMDSPAFCESPFYG